MRCERRGGEGEMCDRKDGEGVRCDGGMERG